MKKLQKLSEMSCGRDCVVVEISAGRELSFRLGELGIFKGGKLSVAKSIGKGPVIVRVFGGELAIGRGQAEKILVECLE